MKLTILAFTFVASTKPPPQVGAAAPPDIEMAAALADPLPSTFPGMPRTRGGPPPAIEETAATSTDQLPVTFPGTLAPANNVPALLMAAYAILVVSVAVWCHRCHRSRRCHRCCRCHRRHRSPCSPCHRHPCRLHCHPRCCHHHVPCR